MTFERINIWGDRVHVQISRPKRKGRFTELSINFPLAQLKNWPALEKEISEIAEQERKRLAGRPAKKGRE